MSHTPGHNYAGGSIPGRLKGTRHAAGFGNAGERE